MQSRPNSERKRRKVTTNEYELKAVEELILLDVSTLKSRMRELKTRLRDRNEMHRVLIKVELEDINNILREKEKEGDKMDMSDDNNKNDDDEMDMIEISDSESDDVICLNDSKVKVKVPKTSTSNNLFDDLSVMTEMNFSTSGRNKKAIGNDIKKEPPRINYRQRMLPYGAPNPTAFQPPPRAVQPFNIPLLMHPGFNPQFGPSAVFQQPPMRTGQPFKIPMQMHHDFKPPIIGMSNAPMVYIQPHQAPSMSVDTRRRVDSQLNIARELSGLSNYFTQPQRNFVMGCLPQQQSYLPHIRSHDVVQQGDDGVDGIDDDDEGARIAVEELEHLSEGQSKDMDETPAEMKRTGITLHPHQRIFLCWGRNVENQFGGGILADEMGLGKTIEMISLMLVNRMGTTLVVAPLSVVNQWADETRRRSDNRLKVLIYHGGGRTKNHTLLYGNDVVITTYGTLSHEFPLERRKGEKKGKRRVNTKKFGPLFKVDWDRIILDEAHLIRNLNTRNFLAVTHHKLGKPTEIILDTVNRHEGTKRWALTGTPIQNKLLDLHALCKFCQIPELGDRESFTKIRDLCEGDEAARGWKLLRKKLREVCMRRTKKQQLFGKPLIILPEKEQILIKLDFMTQDEKDKYKLLFDIGRENVNRLFEKGTAMQNYVNITMILLRLQQICNSYYLVDHVLPVKCVDKDGDAVMEEKKKDLKKRNRVYKSMIRASENEHDIVCPLCKEMMDDFEKIWTKCSGGIDKQHFFCRTCLDEWVNDKGNKFCPVCKKSLKKDIWEERSTSLMKLQRKITSKNFVSSTKINALMNKLAYILENTRDKVLVMSQWVKFLVILEVPLKAMIKKKKKFRKFKFSQLSGKMSMEERKTTIDSARSSMNHRILLVSMRACGLGLNLNFANHVFLMDQWWNPAVENQAIDRTHRIGQRKKVFVYRLIINGTVEETIMEIKKSKQEISNNTFGEMKSLVSKTFNISDIADLFHIGKDDDDDGDFDENVIQS